MSLTASMSVSNPSFLSLLDSGTWSVGQAKISEDDLLSLSSRTDLVITEVNAPLSQVSAATLKLFLQTHGRNLEKFNLQNNRISAKEFACFATMMPQLKTLSFQYLNNIKNEDLLNVIQTCNKLESLRISGNGRISKQVYYQILELDRHFSVLDLDLNGPKAVQDGGINKQRVIRAQVGELRLVGLPFGNDDVTHVATIEGLKTVKFVQTSAEPEAFAKLYEPISPKKKPTIEIVFFSEEKATTCKEFLLNQSIPFTEKTKKTLQISQFNKETSY